MFFLDCARICEHNYGWVRACIYMCVCVCVKMARARLCYKMVCAPSRVLLRCCVGSCLVRNQTRFQLSGNFSKLDCHPRPLTTTPRGSSTTHMFLVMCLKHSPNLMAPFKTSEATNPVRPVPGPMLSSSFFAAKFFCTHPARFRRKRSEQKNGNIRKNRTRKFGTKNDSRCGLD